MRAAIYARRSTEEHQAASLDVQLEEAKRYIARKGWSLDPSHVFVDDAISRAEFKKRPGLIAMLNGAQDHRFDVVVTRDETRLGGDTNRTCLLIQDILDAGVALFYHFTDERVQLNNASAKIMVSLRNFASELEREKISQRTHEHLHNKARRGLNVGGRVYGYDNVDVKDGDRRVRVEYRINPDQAEVVRWLFEKRAAGWGLKRLAKDLNGRSIPSPRAGKRGTGSWSPSAINDMLKNPRYRGQLIWGQYEKTYRGGTRVRVPRPESEWTKVDAPELRLVSDELWLAAQAKKTGTTERKAGRPARYLLSGIGRCSECGGPMQVINGKQGNLPIKAYACSYYRQRGESVCTNSLRRPVEGANEAVVRWIRETVLREAVVMEIVAELRQRLRARGQQQVADVAAFEGEAKRLRGEIANLVAAVATGGSHAEPLIRGIGERQARLTELEGKLKVAQAVPQAIEAEMGRLEEEVKSRLSDLRSLFESNQECAKRVLTALFEDQLTFTPIELPDGSRRYRIEGKAIVGRLFAEETGSVTNRASPAGFEPA